MPGSTRAGDVFNTPELLEHILLGLEPHHILVAQQTNKQWCDTVNMSIKLKQKLGLSADPSGHFYSAFDYRAAPAVRPPLLGLGLGTTVDSAMRAYEERQRRIGETPLSGLICKGWARVFRCDPRAPKLDKEHMFMVKVERAVQERGVGKRYRSMLLCQPPIKEALIEIAVIKQDWEIHRTTTIVAKNGITLGDLLDVIAKHSKADGEELETVTFKHSIKLKDTDPIMKARKKEFDAAVARKAEANNKREAEAGKSALEAN